MTQASAADRKSVRAAEKAAAIDSSLRAAYIRNAMASIEGRAWFHDLLERCHLFHNPFAETDRLTAFACGEMNIGQQTLADIMLYCPELYLQMIRESNERRISRDTASRRDTDPNARGDTSGQYSGSPDTGRDLEAGGADSEYDPFGREDA